MSLFRRFLVAALAVAPTSVIVGRPGKATNHPVRRFHAMTGLRRDRADEYFKLHAAVWPEVLRMIERANIRNFSIAVQEIEGKLYLLSYFEYIGLDYEVDMSMIAADPETQRWWRHTEPCQMPLPDAAARHAIWSEAKEVFYTP